MSRYSTFDSLTEDNIRDSIERSRGDVIVAARLLQVRVKDLTEACETIPGIKAHLLAVNATREANPDFLRMSDEQFGAALKRNKKVYAVDALEEMHSIAMMDIDPENAEMVGVKLKACVELARDTGTGAEGSEIAEILRELNAQYKESAPRIKSLRIELEMQQGLLSAESETPTLAASTPPAPPLLAAAESAEVLPAAPEPEPQTSPSPSSARYSRRAPARPRTRASILVDASPSAAESPSHRAEAASAATPTGPDAGAEPPLPADTAAAPDRTV